MSISRKNQDALVPALNMKRTPVTDGEGWHSKSSRNIATNAYRPIGIFLIQKQNIGAIYC
jgi:hypothetical protein